LTILSIWDIPSKPFQIANFAFVPSSNGLEQKKRILICPLDWGLGHATRCIPIIEELIKLKCDVYIASDGGALSLLKDEFPALTFLEITGYHPRYTSRFLILSLVFQLPKFLRTIRKEHREIEAIRKSHRIDFIISDNRYGCWSPEIPSVFITHQLAIQMPMFSRLINFFIQMKIKNFSACWVPDVAGEQSLAGKLSVNTDLNVVHIGHLSRFQRVTAEQRKYEILAIISGPEPQRTVFEKLIREELSKSGKRAMMVKGIPHSRHRKISGDLDEISHFPAKEMNQVILESDIVISRPGYSTIMDLAKLEKSAVFIPTPGQTEQEYLGKRLMKNEIALSVPQHKFDLEAALRAASRYKGFGSYHQNDLLEKALTTLLA
jgi:UDP-N-acetylglucosamine transferase subunit ALG13